MDGGKHVADSEVHEAGSTKDVGLSSHHGFLKNPNALPSLEFEDSCDSPRDSRSTLPSTGAVEQCNEICGVGIVIESLEGILNSWKQRA